MFKIALDLDDVLVSANDIIIETFKEHGKTKRTALKYMKNWGLPGAPSEIVVSVKEKFKNPKDSCDPNRIYSDSQEWVRRHKDEFELIVVTARPESMAKDTKKFVKKYFGIDHVFVEPVSKTKTLLEQGVDFIIDDGHHNLAPFLNFDTKTIPILLSNELTVYNHHIAKEMREKGLVVSCLSDVTKDYLMGLKGKKFS